MKKILLTGGSGLIGSAIRRLVDKTKYEITWFKSDKIDLRNRGDVTELFSSQLFDYVIHCASRVGGLGAHKGRHIEFLNDNILINTNVLQACEQTQRIKKVICISSVAAFPDNLPMLREDLINSGPVGKHEYGYSLSKRLLYEQCQLLNERSNRYCCLFPVNLYGIDDNFNLQNAHVIPSLIHKFYQKLPELPHTPSGSVLEIWGDGLSIREFLYVDDFANIIYKLLESNACLADDYIVSNSKSYNIQQVIEILRQITGVLNYTLFDDTKSNGLRVRECDTTKLKEIVNPKFTSLKDGLQITWDWFCENYPNVRK